MFKSSLISLFLVAGSSSIAHAWEANIEGPDVFGVTKVLATVISLREGMVVQCDSKEELSFAFIFRKKEFEDVVAGPATLYLQGASSEPLKLPAELRVWNDNYGGVVASGRDPQVLAAIKEIQEARSKLNVGIEIGGSQNSASFGSRGSTKAMEKVIQGCKLADIAKPPA
ncbi:hypothetical protein QEZ47_24380 [Aminobacter anthyllidis]|uniref:hypothetical protein n=1 Tax=Aminobacter anthyllidis TaxID=1035067 RepID=UPI002457262A|nr:hypothetical protein [Aminobacter anthyllidis]MDH4988596.1 hypothetical protein [Aminobacter anthyllidis]